MYAELQQHDTKLVNDNNNNTGYKKGINLESEEIIFNFHLYSELVMYSSRMISDEN